jgi:predicted Zn-dependent protease
MRHSVQKCPRQATLSDKVELARRAENGARTILPEARQVMSVLLDSRRQIEILNSQGLRASESKPIFKQWCRSFAKRMDG